MRYSLYFVWVLAVLSICILTTLASFPVLVNGERHPEPTITAGPEKLRAIKIHRLRCNPFTSSCQLSRHKPQH
ncbi:MAG: hypothetical protein H8K09_05395 [Nitrospira sp.]|jgi:hypothetical protein|nr:hypothetical protein [Nitrospira sp.]ULA68123.1 MAG: hypothetical protein LZF62_320051 [Nitrospira sp.]